MKFLLIGAGGCLGSLCRYQLGMMISRIIVSPMPYHTLSINVLGSFLMGIALAASGDNRSSWFYLIAPGFLGGFTTYSAFAGESLLLLDKGEFFYAVFYMSLTLVSGLIACGAGFYGLKAIWH